ncbi:MAG TPA: DUF5615 family PIN-like protein [Ktedonobacterales bacterium]
MSASANGDHVTHRERLEAAGTTSAPSNGPPRFLADENFNHDVIAGLRRAQPAMDILTAPEAGTLHMPDPDVLVWAAAHDRILLSHDKRTMPDHFYQFLAQLAPGEHSPGVLLLAQNLAIGKAIAAVVEIWELSTHQEWRDLLTRLPLR